MCGRYTLYQTGELSQRFEVPKANSDPLVQELKPSYNVAPGRQMPIVTTGQDGRQLELMRWGLIPVWAKDPKIGWKMINARSETVFEKPSWKRPALKQRCLVPANGFYEWKAEKDGKQPFFVRPKDQELFGFAGVYDHWTDPESQELVRSFSILTTRANREMAGVHERMPVILHPQDEDRWLDATNDQPEDIADLLRPYDDGGLELFEVSREVNRPQNDSKRLIDPAK